MAPGRVLAVRERRLPGEERAPYLAGLAGRRERARAANAHFWVFEHHHEAGRFLEFTEAASPEAVAALLDGAPADGLWHEVQGG
ncbi:MAG: hypothetical protein KJT01_00645 [Gemmatimonadetes bacterium]|nr:hypothetical protein [Gemmatimonadota bacterium]